jgi:hypothetical protein
MSCHSSGKNTFCRNVPTPPTSFVSVTQRALARASGIAFPIATLMPATSNIGTSFPPSPNAMTPAGTISRVPGARVAFRCASACTSAVPLLSVAGMSSRQKVSACVRANDEGGKVARSFRTSGCDQYDTRAGEGDLLTGEILLHLAHAHLGDLCLACVHLAHHLLGLGQFDNVLAVRAQEALGLCVRERLEG